jgi:hypothetical protein
MELSATAKDSTIARSILFVVPRLVEFQNGMDHQIGGIVSPGFSVLSGPNIHENDFGGVGTLDRILNRNICKLEIFDLKTYFR